MSFSIGADVPTRRAGSEKAPASGGSDRPAERRSGHSLLRSAGPASGSGIFREAQPRLPPGDCERVSCTVSCDGTRKKMQIVFHHLLGNSCLASGVLLGLS